MVQMCTLGLREEGAGQLDCFLKPGKIEAFKLMPLSVPVLRKLPGFRGPFDLETWSFERRMWLQRPSNDVGAERTCQEGCGFSKARKKKETKELVQSQAWVLGTERKQILGTAHKLALDMENPVAWGCLGLGAQEATEEEVWCLRAL